jgi:hypothetical protein
VLLEGLGEVGTGLIDLLADLGQVGDAQRRAVLLDDLHQRQIVPGELFVHELELILGEVEGLLDQVDVAGLHAAGGAPGGEVAFADAGAGDHGVGCCKVTVR